MIKHVKLQLICLTSISVQGQNQQPVALQTDEKYSTTSLEEDAGENDSAPTVSFYGRVTLAASLVQDRSCPTLLHP